MGRNNYAIRFGDGEVQSAESHEERHNCRDGVRYNGIVSVDELLYY